MPDMLIEIGARPQIDRAQLVALAEASKAIINAHLELLDALAGDTDEEEPIMEDGFIDANETFGYVGPGCPISDPGGDNVEDQGEAIDEREPDHDEERDTWAHHNDHPAGLFVAGRANPGFGKLGVDQRRWVGPDNPEAA